MRRFIGCAVLVFIAGLGCSEEVEGPEPRMDHSPEQMATDPSFVCSEAHGEEGSWVELDGEAFSPLVVDSIASEDDDDVQLPVVILSLVEGPAGESIDAIERFELESPLGEEDGRIRWVDDETIQFRISDDLELPEGVYDIEVTNPNGRTVTESEAFGVLDRPRLDEAIPEMTCVAQGERDITLVGDNLLVQGDDEQVPTVDLDGEQVDVIDTGDCRELHDTFTDHSLCEELTVRVDEQQLEAGVYDVRAENFAPAGCPSDPEEDEVTVTVNDPPVVQDISPSPVCSEQIEYAGMQIDGEEFITVEQNGDTVYPEVALGDQVYEAVDAEGCEPVESAPALSAERCERVLIDVADGDLAAQVDDDTTHEDLHVEVTNPDPVGCHSEQDEFLTAMPRPQIEAIDPDPMCTAQYENSFRVEGHGFAEIDGQTPVVHIGDNSYEVDPDDIEDCIDIDTPDVPTASCNQLTVSIAEEDLDSGANEVVVENPETAHCESTEEASAKVVAPPQVDEVDPQPLCTDQEDRTLEIAGEGFLDIDGQLPEVAIGDEEFGADELDGCDELELFDDDSEAHDCSELTVTVSAGVIDDGTHPVVVTNPESAQCESEDAVDVETVPPPVITSVEPRALCSDDDTTTFELEGEHLYEVDGDAPEIILDGITYATNASQCTDVDDDTRLCDQLTFDADPDDVSDDLHELVAVNPDPVGCDSDPSDPVMLAGPPEITETEPLAVCETEPLDGDMSIFGQFLHDPTGDDPTITMNGTETSVEAFVDCDTTDLGDIDIDSCDELQTTVPDHLRDQAFDITVEAPEPVACGEDTIHIEEVEQATVSNVDPGRVCVEGGTFEVFGENIHSDAQAYLDGIPASTVDVAADGESATVTFDGPLDPPEMTLEVLNPGDCGEAYEEDITIEQAPIPLYVDPPATFDGMVTQITIYAAGVGSGNIDSVELVHPSDGSVTDLDISIDADRPYVVQATVPEGMLADDEDSVDFGVRVTDDFDCQSDTEDLLTITADPTIAIDEIRPPFGPGDEDTGVTITADADDGDTFEPTPRAYLNPNDVEGDATVAREIRAVQYIDDTQLNGIVSAGLPLGTYDLIVVNPDGEVGVLEEGYAVVDEAPPLVDSVSPGSWTNDETELEVDVEGSNFRDDADVDVFCQQAGEDLDEDDMRQPGITIIDVESDHIDLEVDTTDLNHLDACFMRVTNPDGTWGEYSPITVTNPAGKFMEFHAGAEMDTARRGPTLLSGVPARQANYLYALGGDDGSVTGEVYASGEYAAIDRFGEPREWNELRFDLPEGRTLANGVRVDDFLYLIGGALEDGLATDEIIRAHIPTPAEAPEIIGLDLTYDEDDFEEEDDEPDADDGLEAGLYYYRVAATYSDDDPANPDGESLGSEPQAVNVPLDGATVSIEWDEPDEETNHEIDGYRIYRSVEPDSLFGEEELLDTVDADTFEYTDDDSITPSGDEPLSIGALGTWHHFADLEQPRMVAGIDSIKHPDEDDEHLIYVVGGEDDTTDFRADYEYFSVEIDAPREQSVGLQPAIGEDDGEPMELAGPRGELEIGIAHTDNAPSVSDVRPQLFVIGGQTEGSDNNRDLFVATIEQDGSLSEWTHLDDPGQRLNNDRFGHAGAAINDNLVVAGGHSGNPDDGARHAEIECDGDCPPAQVSTPPGWQDFGENLVEERVWMGQHIFRGFWYLGGGLTTGDVPTSTVEYTVAGGAP